MVYINRNAQINGIESFRTLLILLSISATFFVKTNIDGGIWRLVSESAFPPLAGAQIYLGMALGFLEKSADMHLIQHETRLSTPKAELIATLSQVPDVSPNALSVSDIDSYVGLMYTPFLAAGRCHVGGGRNLQRGLRQVTLSLPGV